MGTERGSFAFLHPADVRGPYQNLRTGLFALLILVYLALPWLRVGGEQAVLLDIAHRRFVLFGAAFWAHDAPKLVLVLAGAAFTLCWITAVWGRLWCGYACPQTVFVAACFRRIERLVEGPHLARQRLAGRPFTPEWALRKGLKWLLFLAVALVLAHSFLAYFVGTERLREAMLLDPRRNGTLFLAMLSLAAFVLVDFAWLRERLCFTLCPYGRFQTVLMDRRSLAVVYDARRGEPRRGTSSPEGDCVDCARCVQVCPTGIDIRDGVQMECIACTACLDACDEVMGRLGREPGLVRYDTEAGLAGEPRRGPHTRASLYLALTLLSWGALALVLGLRSSLDVVAFRAGGAPYQEVRGPGGEGLVINHLRFDLTNLTHQDLPVRIALPRGLQAKGMELVLAANPLTVPAGKSLRADLFIKFPKSILDLGRTPATVEFRDGERRLATEELTLVGPYQ